MMTSIRPDEIYTALATIQDPEIPVLSVLDLGMITHIDIKENYVLVKMIPTYAACPAVNYIRNHIKKNLEETLAIQVIVELDNTILWNSDRITDIAKKKLKNFGIATPKKLANCNNLEEYFDGTPCVHCESNNTVLKTPFGSTLCRAIHYCLDCKQSFEHFKPLE